MDAGQCVPSPVGIVLVLPFSAVVSAMIRPDRGPARAVIGWPC